MPGEAIKHRRRKPTIPVEIDYVIAVCAECKEERRFDLVPRARGRHELRERLERELVPCPCGGVHCAVQTHAVEGTWPLGASHVDS